MNDFIEALKEVKIYGKDFKITLSKKEVLEITNEIDRLHSIIKEVREYIENNTLWFDDEFGLVEMEGYQTNRIPVVKTYYIDEILDKESKLWKM